MHVRDLRFRVILILFILGLFWWLAYPLNKKIHLGLDLQGGVDITYTIDVGELKKILADQKVQLIRDKLDTWGIINYKVKVVNGKDIYVKVDGLDRKKLVELEILLQAMKGYKFRKEGEGEYTLILDEKNMQQILKDAQQRAVTVIRNRVDQLGVKEVNITTAGGAKIRVQIPGIKDAKEALDIIGRTAILQFRIVKGYATSLNDKVDEDSEIVPGVPDPKTGMVRYYVLDKRILLTGDTIADASIGFDQVGRPAVNIAFNDVGAKRFADITSKHVGEQLAIVLDGRVQSAPVIQEPIYGGRARITGNFTDEEAKKLAIILRAGALPAPLKKLGANVVGPTLGLDSIKKSSKAMIIGLILVMIYMIFLYGLFGIFADIALIANLIILMGAMTYFGATLTLPGIAGILLTIGMAVDANVLIFERIKEELRLGKTVLAAIESGFDKAFVTILDANLTTLITAIILYIYGTGPIRGFAVTLSIGIAASMFTAIYVVRTIIEAFYKLFNWKVINL